MRGGNLAYFTRDGAAQATSSPHSCTFHKNAPKNATQIARRFCTRLFYNSAQKWHPVTNFLVCQFFVSLSTISFLTSFCAFFCNFITSYANGTASRVFWRLRLCSRWLHTQTNGSNKNFGVAYLGLFFSRHTDFRSRLVAPAPP